MGISLPEDEEFKTLLNEALKKPMKSYEERAERAVKGSRHIRRS